MQSILADLAYALARKHPHSAASAPAVFSGRCLGQGIITDLVVQLDRSINHHMDNTHMQMLQTHAAAVRWLLSSDHVSHVSVPCM